MNRAGIGRHLVIPAVDILGGRCVRLLKGDFQQVTDYGTPLAVARRWREQGAVWLHVVDLDGARTGRPQSLAAAAEIRRQVGCRVQFGGGLRGEEAVAEALAVVDRVIVSSWALRSPSEFSRVAQRFPGRIFVSLDVKDGRVHADGWQTTVPGDPAELAQKLMAAGAAGTIVTAIDKDGTLQGVDAAAVTQLNSWGVPWLWAGGIATAGDLRTIFRTGGDQCAGVIVGRAIYEGTLTLDEAWQEVAACATNA